MKTLYFGSIVSSITSLAIVSFIIFSVSVFLNRRTFTNWGGAFIFMLILGVFLSAMSGTRDGIGTPNGFPTVGTLFVVLCILGGLGFLIGGVALIFKIKGSSTFYLVGYYMLTAIIIIKMLLVEVNRISDYLKIN